MEKIILDVTCGNRGMWFNKEHPLALYCDKRNLHIEKQFGKNHGGYKTIDVYPDIQCDFTDLPFGDNSFQLVVFDPPHALNLSEKSWTRSMYGTYESKEEMIDNITRGFRECMRVLRTYGILIFKWSEISIPTSEIIKAFGEQPLFGHHSGKKMNTNWLCFMRVQE